MPSSNIAQMRIPPHRPYLTVFEAIKLSFLGLIGIFMFIMPLLEQYDSLSPALHLLPNVNQLSTNIPSSLPDGLFAPRYVFMGVTLPAGLISLFGIFMLVYAVAQSSFRLSIRSRFLWDWYVPLSPALLVITLGLWFVTFSTILSHDKMSWLYVIGIQEIFWGEPILLHLVGAPREEQSGLKKIPFGLLFMILAFFVLRNHYGVTLPIALAVVLGSIPLGVIIFFVYTMAWFFKVITLTGEYHDYYYRD